MSEVVRFRHNVLDISSISTFESIKGGVNNNCKDVYFVRLLGINETFLEDIKKMDQRLTMQMQQGRLIYKRISQLPRLASVEVAKFYGESYQTWIEGGRKELSTKTSVRNKALREVLSTAVLKVLEQYKVVNPRINESIEKSFLAKIMFWFDQVTMDVLKDWTIRTSVKIVAFNVEKEQEYLFYYLLTLIGFDVLLMQNEKDIDGKVEKLALSKKSVLGTYAKCSVPPYEEQSKQETKPVTPTREPEKPTREPVKITRESVIPTREPVVTARQENRHSANNGEKTLEQLACLASSVVLIAIHDPSGKVIGSGSGIMIGSNGYILTNCHVASGGVSYSIRVEEDEQIYTTDELIKYNSVLDLAILRINRILNPLTIYSGKGKLVRGQKVVAIGSPLGLFNSVSDGIISGFRVIDGVDMIQFTAPTSHGSSGGAVLNMRGEVIGISTAGIDSGQNLNLAVGCECINNFIKGFV